MPITKQLSSLSNVKQLTGADAPQNPGSLVTYTYGPAASTAGQTIINLGFSVSTTNTTNFFLWIDGKLMSLGSSNDYTFTNVQANGTSSQVTMTQVLAANLNINASYLGVLVPTAASTSILTLQASLAGLNGYALKTSNYTLTSTDVIVQFNCSSGNLVATLPSAASVTVGQRYEITRAADATPANTLTVNTTSAQTIQGRASGSIKLSPSDYLIVVSDGNNWQIAEIQETVASIYTMSTGQSVAATTTDLKYDTKVRDTHSAYNTSTGVYTVQVAGQYRVTGGATFTSGTTVTQLFRTQAAQAGSTTRTVIMSESASQNTTSNSYSPIGSCELNCAVGDTIKIQFFNGTAAGSLAVDANRNHMSITKVGN
jgi:hypothetical protein